MTDNRDLHDKCISRLYRMGSNTEPSKHIDEKIIQAAHNTAPNRKQRFTWTSLATAAVLVLSMSLVLKVLNQEPLERSVPEPPSTGHSLETVSPAKQEMEEITEDRAAAPTTVLQDEAVPRTVTPKQKAKPDSYRSAPKKPAASPVTVDDAAVGAAVVVPLPAARGRVQLQQRSFKKREPPKLQMEQKAMSSAPPGRFMRLDCNGVQLPKTDSVEEWILVYKAAVKQGQIQTAKCLKQAYFTRFGKAMPDSAGE